MPEHSTFLTTLKEKLDPEANEIISLKYSGKVFGAMNEDELWFASKTLLLKIHTITGWTIPISELMDILIDQFKKKLSEGYKKVNISEIEYAFRNRSIDLKDWGKALNLTMIDEVMLPYLESRLELSKMEESLKTKSLMIDEKRELTDEDWEEWLEDMKGYELKLLPCAAYDYLVKKGLLNLTTPQKHEYMERAISVLQSSFEAGTKEMLEYLVMKKDGKFSATATSSLVTISKRLAIYDYLKNTTNDLPML